MALFGSKKNTDKTSKKVPAKTVRKVADVHNAAAPVMAAEKKSSVSKSTAFPKVNSSVLRPRITEKASFSSELSNVYTFEVTKESTKKDIAAFIETTYKFKPLKVHIAKIPSKKVYSRGKRGVKRGGKKAYVYLKAGEKIEFI